MTHPGNSQKDSFFPTNRPNGYEPTGERVSSAKSILPTKKNLHTNPITYKSIHVLCLFEVGSDFILLNKYSIVQYQTNNNPNLAHLRTTTCYSLA